MQTNVTTRAGLALLALLALTPTPAEAAYSRVYQGAGYKYRTYSYYSRAHGQTRHHMAVYQRSKPRHVYYYNPYSRKYWGRYDVMTGRYSLLAEADRKGTLAEIPEKAFPPGGAMPPPEPGGEPMPPPPAPEPEPGPSPGPRVTLPPSSGGCRKY